MCVGHIDTQYAQVRAKVRVVLLKYFTEEAPSASSAKYSASARESAAAGIIQELRHHGKRQREQESRTQNFRKIKASQQSKYTNYP